MKWVAWCLVVFAPSVVFAQDAVDAGAVPPVETPASTTLPPFIADPECGAVLDAARLCGGATQCPVRSQVLATQVSEPLSVAWGLNGTTAASGREGWTAGSAGW